MRPIYERKDQKESNYWNLSVIIVTLFQTLQKYINPLQSSFKRVSSIILILIVKCLLTKKKYILVLTLSWLSTPHYCMGFQILSSLSLRKKVYINHQFQTHNFWLFYLLIYFLDLKASWCLELDEYNYKIDQRTTMPYPELN